MRQILQGVVVWRLIPVLTIAHQYWSRTMMRIHTFLLVMQAVSFELSRAVREGFILHRECLNQAHLMPGERLRLTGLMLPSTNRLIPILPFRWQGQMLVGMELVQRPLFLLWGRTVRGQRT